MDKVWWKSKSIILSVVGGLAMALSAVFPQASVVTQWINANTAVVASVWSVLAIVVRFLTKDKVVLTD